jgi:hypothetical protein
MGQKIYLIFAGNGHFDNFKDWQTLAYGPAFNKGKIKFSKNKANIKMLQFEAFEAKQ